MNQTLKTISTRRSAQSQPILGAEQVRNRAGGFVYEVDDWTRLHRWLILGSEGGSYYASERELTLENAEVVARCLAADGLRTVAIVRSISVEGRAPRNDQAIFALAMAAGLGDERTRAAALEALSDVCRIGTHLFAFATYVEQFRGWGRALRRAVGCWYSDREPGELAYQAIKYRQRLGWSHRDLLRLAHPVAPTPTHDALYDWIVRGNTSTKIAAYLDSDDDNPLVNIDAFERAQRAKTPAETAELVRRYRLPHEALRTEHAGQAEVWQALLDAGLPMTALIRNLARMTRNGLLVAGSQASAQVVAQLSDGEALRRARVHPVTILIALRTYALGRSPSNPSATWSPVAQVIDALDAAFDQAFDNIEPTGKRWLLALDVSGSMGTHRVAGIPNLSAREAAAAMAMTVMRSGDPFEVVGFTGAHGGWCPVKQDARDLTPLGLSGRQRLDDVVRAVKDLPMGSTDCALPALYAAEHGREFDAIAIYTDNESWVGKIHASQAMEAYRRCSGIADAKLLAMAFTATSYSVADPNDANSLDLVGFDTSTPQIANAFVEGGF